MNAAIRTLAAFALVGFTLLHGVSYDHAAELPACADPNSERFESAPDGGAIVTCGDSGIRLERYCQFVRIWFPSGAIAIAYADKWWTVTLPGKGGSFQRDPSGKMQAEMTSDGYLFSGTWHYEPQPDLVFNGPQCHDD
jgi:hypothetical protein